MTQEYTSEFNWENGEDAFPPENTGLTGDSRTEARLCAVQSLYQAIIMPRDARDVAADFETKLNKRKADKKLYRAIMASAGEGAERYHTMLQAELTEKWEWNRVDPVLRALGWAGAAELTANPEAPVAVILNEYLNISKAFVTPEEVGYLNKTLDNLSKKIRG
ncbi:MAG: hypothetical protein DI585_04980 [Pseudomonas fluorescens]|nr:MAG: hypothetical protein DI585_04980 [Pseudomonas fluorescens]